MWHIFLNPEVMHAEVEMQRRSHAYRTQISCAVRTGSYLINLCEIRNFPQMRDSACMHDRRANEIDQLLLNELLAIENRIEYLPYGQRRGRVLTNQSKALLQLSR